MLYIHFPKKELKIGPQNFKNGTVPISHNGVTTICPMFAEEDGEIGFVFNNEKYYFSDYMQSPDE